MATSIVTLQNPLERANLVSRVLSLSKREDPGNEVASARATNLEPRVSPALCQRLVAGTNSGITEFLSLKSWDTVCNAHACN